MRKTDRGKNGMAFPKLYYPELYLLEGGYKAFYAKYPVSCRLPSTLLFTKRQILYSSLLELSGLFT